MDFLTLAGDMYPYWILGILVALIVIYAGKKRLLRIEKKPILVWSACLIALTAWRCLINRTLGHTDHESIHGALMIPWVASFTVFWEDLCHGLPLAICEDLLGEYAKNAWARLGYGVLLVTIMMGFGLGHLYQGLFAVLLLALYVPYSVDLGKRFGFGTLAICHILYDLVTLLYLHYWMLM